MRVCPSMQGAESDPASSLSKEMGAVGTMWIKHSRAYRAACRSRTWSRHRCRQIHHLRESGPSRALAVRRGQGAGDLSRQPQRVSDGHGTLQGRPFDELHDQVIWTNAVELTMCG